MDNLSRDVREAERLGYGVHYGRYKADYPHTADHSVDLDPPESVTRKCAECGQTFVSGRVNQKYCSNECKNRVNQRTRYQKKKTLPLPKGPAVCPVCGGSFTRQNRSQIYCSRSCSATANNLNRRKRETNSAG